MSEKKLVGWYSQKQREVIRFFGPTRKPPQTHAACVYSTPDGQEVVITEVIEEGDPDPTWDDAIRRGPVVKFLRVLP